jgi:acetylornithine deacetylase/succinyl-diaminopimelate desuccinylase-like protein
MKKTLQKLISFKSITQDRKENNKILSWVKEQIKGLPLYFKNIESNGFKSLVVTTQKTKTPKLFLMAHLDVVPGPETLFKARIEESRLIGRGASDMKFATACYLKLLKELGDNLKNYNFGVIWTTDEEIGGLNGAKAVKEAGYKADVYFLPDGGKDWNIENEAKGVWHLKIKSKGKSVHGSRPWQGENAIEELINFLVKLKKYFPISKDEKHYHRTLNIGTIKGGEATNKVPDFAEAKIDIRYLPQEGKAKIKEILDLVKKDFKNIKIESLISGDSFKIDKNNKYVQIARNIIKKDLGKDSDFEFSHGASDARFFQNKPVILVRPNGGGLHSKGEWIDLNELKDFYLLIKSFVEKVAK